MIESDYFKDKGMTMESPVRYKRKWWQYDHQRKKLYQWNPENGNWVETKGGHFPPPPSRWHLRGISGSEPFYIYLFGVLAAIVALWITIAIVPKDAPAVLAPVMGVIGAFTGHAAGHSSAVSAVKEGKAEAPTNLSKPQENSADSAGDKR